MGMMPEDTRVTMADVADLAELLRAAEANARVARLIFGIRFDGTARRICAPGGGSAIGLGTDMRDLCLEVTLDGGAEARWPVRVLMQEYRRGEFLPWRRG